VILDGLELRLGEGAVIGDVGAAVGLGDPEGAYLLSRPRKERRDLDPVELRKALKLDPVKADFASLDLRDEALQRTDGRLLGIGGEGGIRTLGPGLPRTTA
jgi:hypothetical protein